jgi:hypothetical protein
MKKMFILALMSVMVSAVSAQVVNTESVMGNREATKMRPDTVMPNGEWQKVVETTLTAKEGFKYMRQTLAKIVPNYQRNVQMEDTTDCRLVVMTALPLMARAGSGYWLQGFYRMTLTVIVKDNRYRVSAEQVKCQTDLTVNVPGVDTSQGISFQTMSKGTNGGMQKDLRWQAGRMLAKIDAMLKKQKADDDF